MVGNREELGVIRDPWANRSDGMKCATCMWFVPKVAFEGEIIKLGRCRKNAPTMGGFPVVFMEDWCGQHKLDEAKLAGDLK